MSASKKMSRRFVRGAVLPAAVAWMGLVGASVGLMQGVCAPPPPETPITVTATASATTVQTGTPVTITTVVANATGTVTYRWDLAGVGSLAGAPEGAQRTFLSNLAGLAIVTVTASDSGTETTATTTVNITVTAPAPPVCALAVTASGPAVVLPLTGTLSSAITTAGTPPYTFSWLQTAGDPAGLVNDTGQNTVVAFPIAGSYTFNVTVTDDVGCTANDDVTVAVTGTPATVDTTFTLNIDNLTGSAGDDVFDAAQVWDFGALRNTLQTGDRAEGNGGDDALNASIDLSIAAIRPNLTNIQTINVAASAGGFALQLDNSSGITAVNSDNSLAIVEFNALQSLPTTIGLFNTNTGLTLSAIVASATAGGSDSTTLQLSGARLAGGLEPTAIVTLNTAAASGIETLTIDSGGSSANEIDVLLTTGNTTSMTTLNVTGSQALEIMDWSGGVTLPNSIITVDASAMTGGGVALRMGTGATTTFTGSPFDDLIYYGGNYNPGDAIAGGAGNDTLAVTTALAAPAANQTNVASIEAITITDAHTTTPVFTRFNPTGTIAQVNLEAGFTGGTVTLPTASNVVIGKKHTNNVAGAGVGIVTLSGAAAGTVTLTLADADPAGLITVNNASTLTVELVSSGNLNGNAASGNLNVITTGVTLANAGASVVNITGDTDLTAGTVTAGTINAGTFARALTITLPATGATFTGGTGVDTVTGGAGADTISTGDGNDVILAPAVADGADAIDAGDGNDTITGGSGLDVLTGGTGADTFVYNGAAGATQTSGGVDTIADFVVGTDKIQFTGVVDVVSAQQVAVQTAVTALGAGATDAAIVGAIITANTTNLAVSVGASVDGNTYVVFERTGASVAFVVADDVAIKLVGVTLAQNFTFAVDVTP